MVEVELPPPALSVHINRGGYEELAVFIVPHSEDVGDEILIPVFIGEEFALEGFRLLQVFDFVFAHRKEGTLVIASCQMFFSFFI